MVDRTGSFRSKTRKKLRKCPRDRGKISITRFLQKFEVGDKVRILQEPAVHKGMPHPRYKNKVGTIIGKQGRAYIIEIKEGGKIKKLLSVPIHLAKVV